MPREIKGIEALSAAFPPEWLLYVSLNCYPRNQDPMEIDAVIVTGDFLLILEIKDWNGKLTSQQDRWYIGGRSRGRSPVIASDEKAKKLKSVLGAEMGAMGTQFYVESRVVLTGSANKSALPAHEIPYVWTLAEACSLGDAVKRKALFPRTQMKLVKAYTFEGQYDKVFRNTKLFQPLEADWSGYKVVEQDVFVHPRGVWHDHRAERRDETRIKGMVRTWSFDKLPPGVNSGEHRKLVALRETNAFAHLRDLESELISRNRVLRDVITPEEEIATNHHEVREISNGWNTLDRYLEIRREDLSVQDRVVITSGILNVVSQLHRADVSHRDIGPRAVWIGSPSDLALTGFMSCQLPDKKSIMDWLTDLRGYAPALPEDHSTGSKSTGRQRDVYTCAYLAAMILTGVRPDAGPAEAVAALPEELSSLAEWLRRGLAADPTSRFSDVIAMTEEFSELIETKPAEGIDQALLDHFETTVIPYTRWTLKTSISQTATRQVYSSLGEDGKAVIVKVWMGMVRGRSLSSDYALLRLLDSASRLMGSPIKGLPLFVASGLSPVGAFVVYEHCDGVPLDTVTNLAGPSALRIGLQLLLAVTAMHDLDCEHGDISAANVLVNVEEESVHLLDPFDIGPVGDGSVRTPALCPPNWERLGQRALDRFATIKVVQIFFSVNASELLAPILQVLEAELAKPVIESLEVSTNALRKGIEVESATPRRTVEITTPVDTYGFKGGSGFFVRRKLQPNNHETFFVTSTTGQIIIEGDGEQVMYRQFRGPQFTSLAHESRAGVPMDMTISVSPGQEAGVQDLYQLLRADSALAAPLRTASAKDDDTSAFDVSRHWNKLMELEEDARVEIGIREVLTSREGATVYSYDNLGKDFDFDDEDTIEVYSANRRIGEVDLSLSAFPAAVAIRCDSKRVRPGDRLRLAGRREQTSMDRRARAVKRILDQRSAIPTLIDYLAPQADIAPTSYPLSIAEEDLKAYQLNDGQEHAFRTLLSCGPVGLLQGPPGTGKTRFIAAFAHWLISKGGSQRILIASQSHEAVNNAIDSLLLLHKHRGDKPSLLRIGSKGITERIKPYHSAELRERYRVRFEAAAKFRFSQLTSAMGIDKQYASDLFDLDQNVGKLARRCATVQAALDDDPDQLSTDRARNKVQQTRVEDSFRAAVQAQASKQVDASQPMEEYALLVEELSVRHSTVSPADVNAALKVLSLTHEWLSALGSPRRNYEEFLAKTRRVVAATCVGVGQTRIRIDSQVFDWVIVDEAARCTPGELAVPIQMARRVLLVGDHLQLKPMFTRDFLDQLEESEPDLSREQLAMSDFERAFTSPYGAEIGVRFTEQYRMDPAICTMVSKCFYEPFNVKLETSDKRVPSLANTDLQAPWLSKPMCWVDTSQHVSQHEVLPTGLTTYHNNAEVDAVIMLLERLSADQTLLKRLSEQEDETPIGVICTYTGQKRRIETAWSRHAWDQNFRSMVRIDTVDAYQGKENAIVILSLVRSNDDGRPGHVNQRNRCNVSVSRAKERLIVVGSLRMWGEKVHESSPMREVLSYMQSDPANATILAMGDLA
ncbi:MAG: AAA domain-containing protein [Burkholderiaceae bacterium]|nr:AAA domain-containing protein [Burkholderiaceae bacterium]